MESEYVGATHAAKELIWLRRLLGEIFRSLIFPIKHEEMIADIFTKPLSNIKVKKFSRGLGLLPV